MPPSAAAAAAASSSSSYPPAPHLQYQPSLPAISAPNSHLSHSDGSEDSDDDDVGVDGPNGRKRSGRVKLESTPQSAHFHAPYYKPPPMSLPMPMSGVVGMHPNPNAMSGPMGGAMDLNQSQYDQMGGDPNDKERLGKRLARKAELGQTRGGDQIWQASKQATRWITNRCVQIIDSSVLINPLPASVGLFFFSFSSRQSTPKEDVCSSQSKNHKHHFMWLLWKIVDMMQCELNCSSFKPHCLFRSFFGL